MQNSTECTNRVIISDGSCTVRGSELHNTDCAFTLTSWVLAPTNSCSTIDCQQPVTGFLVFTHLVPHYTAWQKPHHVMLTKRINNAAMLQWTACMTPFHPTSSRLAWHEQTGPQQASPRNHIANEAQGHINISQSCQEALCNDSTVNTTSHSLITAHLWHPIHMPKNRKKHRTIQQISIMNVRNEDQMDFYRSDMTNQQQQSTESYNPPNESRKLTIRTSTVSSLYA